MAKKVSKAAAGGAKKVAKKAAKKRSTKASARTALDDASGKPALLSGGNPQIAKGYGDAPVQAYIAAMPGWKRDVGRRLDALIVRAVPGVRKAVKWNSPFYGIGGRRRTGSSASMCFTKYVKVAFFRGASLRPMPPGESKQKDVRYLDIHEDDDTRREPVRRLGQAGERVAGREDVSGSSVGWVERSEPIASIVMIDGFHMRSTHPTNAVWMNTALSAATRTITTDGRTLACLEVGDPNGPLVIHNHGGPSSRLEARLFAEAASKHGLRLHLRRPARYRTVEPASRHAPMPAGPPT